MHEPLAEALELRRARLSGGHLGEIGVHAAVPAAEAAHFFAGVKFLNVVALTGRADEGAGAAAEAAFGQLLPFRAVEEFLRFACAHGGQIETGQRELFEKRTRFFLLGRDCRTVRILQHGKVRGQRRALFRVGLPEERFVLDPAADIALRGRRIDAEGRTEARFLWAGAGQRYDGAVCAAGGEIRVLRLGKEDAVENFKASRVARAHAEQDERFRRVTRFHKVKLFARHTEADEVFHLREKQILGRADGVELLGKRYTLLPDGEAGLTGGIVCRNIELLCCRHGSKQALRLREGKLFHCAPPLS